MAFGSPPVQIEACKKLFDVSSDEDDLERSVYIVRQRPRVMCLLISEAGPRMLPEQIDQLIAEDQDGIYAEELLRNRRIRLAGSQERRIIHRFGLSHLFMPEA